MGATEPQLASIRSARIRAARVRLETDQIRSSRDARRAELPAHRTNWSGQKCWSEQCPRLYRVAYELRAGQTTNCLMRVSFKLECLERLTRLGSSGRLCENVAQIYSFCAFAPRRRPLPSTFNLLPLAGWLVDTDWHSAVVPPRCSPSTRVSPRPSWQVRRPNRCRLVALAAACRCRRRRRRRHLSTVGRGCLF